MYKKLMVAVLAVMVIGVALDCHAANKMNARRDGSVDKRARARLKSALEFSAAAAAAQAAAEQRRPDELSVTVVRAVKAAAKRAAVTAQAQEKDSLIDSLRKKLDQQAIK